MKAAQGTAKRLGVAAAPGQAPVCAGASEAAAASAAAGAGAATGCTHLVDFKGVTQIFLGPCALDAGYSV